MSVRYPNLFVEKLPFLIVYLINIFLIILCIILASILHPVVDVRVLVKFQEFGKYSIKFGKIEILSSSEFSGEYGPYTRVWRKMMANYHLNQIKLSQMVRMA